MAPPSAALIRSNVSEGGAARKGPFSLRESRPLFKTLRGAPLINPTPPSAPLAQARGEHNLKVTRQGGLTTKPLCAKINLAIERLLDLSYTQPHSGTHGARLIAGYSSQKEPTPTGAGSFYVTQCNYTKPYSFCIIACLQLTAALFHRVALQNHRFV